MYARTQYSYRCRNLMRTRLKQNELDTVKKEYNSAAKKARRSLNSCLIATTFETLSEGELISGSYAIKQANVSNIVVLYVMANW